MHLHPRLRGFELTSDRGAPLMRITDGAKWLATSTAETRDRDDGRGIRLVCSLSNDAGVAVGVVVALQSV